ncbi:MAG: hypothetical protein Kow00124_20630 [Anaerolineae bacterium]
MAMSDREKDGLRKFFSRRKSAETARLYAEPASEPDEVVEYVRVPHTDDFRGERPVWRVQLVILNTGSPQSIWLEINDEIVLGVAKDQDNIVDLTPYNARALGVSRRHLLLRPTETNLFVLDLNSTNGTRRNGVAVGSVVPQLLHNGDILSLGNLLLGVNIVAGPTDWVAKLADERDIANALEQLATAITSQLKLDDVFHRILEMIISFTHADGAAMWLVDEKTGDLHLRAEKGLGDSQSSLVRVPADSDYYLTKVLEICRPMRAYQKSPAEKVKVKTGYLVSSALFVPLAIGESAIGVIAAVHHREGKEFSRLEERRLITISRFAVIAIQNSREYEATNRALAERVEELAAINNLSRDLSAALSLTGVYDVIRTHLTKRWEVEHIGLWIFNEGKKLLEPFPRPTFHKAYHLGEGIIGGVAQDMEARLGQDVEVHSASATEAHSNDATLQFVAHATAAVPLVMKNKIIGVVAAFSKKPRCFDDDDLRLMQAFAHPIAAAVQNAQFVTQIEQHWETVLSTINMLPHPLLIVNRQGELVVSNKAAEKFFADVRLQATQPGQSVPGANPLADLLEGLSESRWKTRKIKVGGKTYLVTVEEASWVGTIILMQDAAGLAEPPEQQEQNTD